MIYGGRPGAKKTWGMANARPLRQDGEALVGFQADSRASPRVPELA